MELCADIDIQIVAFLSLNEVALARSCRALRSAWLGPNPAFDRVEELGPTPSIYVAPSVDVPGLWVLDYRITVESGGVKLPRFPFDALAYAHGKLRNVRAISIRSHGRDLDAFVAATYRWKLEMIEFVDCEDIPASAIMACLRVPTLRELRLGDGSYVVAPDGTATDLIACLARGGVCANLECIWDQTANYDTDDEDGRSLHGDIFARAYENCPRLAQIVLATFDQVSVHPWLTKAAYPRTAVLVPAEAIFNLPNDGLPVSAYLDMRE